MINPAFPNRLLRTVLRTAKTWCLKTILLLGLTALALNPNLKRAFLQVQHTFHPEKLIQTDFPGLERIHAKLDMMQARDQGRTMEVKLIEQFVYDHIRYVSDYKNWGNIEYWPTAQEVWERRQEDCDGRAILAVSIMRARGFSSARLVVGLNHMWAEVDAHEKKRHKPEKLTALLGPDPNLSLPLEENPDARHFLRLAAAFLHPTAFRETGSGLLAEIPPLRKVILILLFLVLCYHPCRNPRGLAAILGVGASSGMLLAGASASHPGQFGTGLALLASAAFGALLMNRWGLAPLTARSSSLPRPATAPPGIHASPSCG